MGTLWTGLSTIGKVIIVSLLVIFLLGIATGNWAGWTAASKEDLETVAGKVIVNGTAISQLQKDSTANGTAISQLQKDSTANGTAISQLQANKADKPDPKKIVEWNKKQANVRRILEERLVALEKSATSTTATAASVPADEPGAPAVPPSTTGCVVNLNIDAEEGVATVK